MLKASRIMSRTLLSAPGTSTPRHVNKRPRRNQSYTTAVTAEISPLQGHVSNSNFAEFVQQGLLSPLITFPFATCTDVQAQTLPVILRNEDVLAQAKTGTGKTLAFLLPILQNLISTTPRPGQISALILSPTRELAMQIAAAGQPLLAKLPHLAIQIVVGGVNQAAETRRLQTQRCDILVATPGRLSAQLKEGGLEANMQDLKVLVLDEADRLLDAGFKAVLQDILQHLPDRRTSRRQGLLFSATIPEGVKEVARSFLDPKYTFISTLAPDEINTHMHVPQFVAYTDLPHFFTTLVSILRQEVAQTPNSKIMLFLPTARSTGLVYSMLAELEKGVLGGAGADLPIWQIHSRMSQSARSRTTDAFKQARGGILVSSDVTARGMDFPLVTLVLQAGLPSDAQQYIHRLGRTARAGAMGRGVLLLCDFERFFLKTPVIRELPIEPFVLDDSSNVDTAIVDRALDKVSDESKAQAWQAWLGYYKGFVKPLGMSIPTLIKTSDVFAQILCRYVGEDGNRKPPILAKTLGKMGLRDHRSLFNIVTALPESEKGTQQRGQSNPRPSIQQPSKPIKPQAARSAQRRP